MSEKAPSNQVTPEAVSEEIKTAVTEQVATQVAEQVAAQVEVAVTEKVAEQVAVVQTEVAAQVALVDEHVTAVKDEVTAQVTAVQTEVAAKVEEHAAAVQTVVEEQVAQVEVHVAEQVAAVREEVQQAAEVAAKAKTEMAAEVVAQVEVKVAEQVAAAAEALQQTAKAAITEEIKTQTATAQAVQVVPARHEQDQSLIHKMVKTQSVHGWVYICLIIALIAYIMADKIRDERVRNEQAPIPLVTEEIQLPSIINMLEAEKQPPEFFQGGYEQIVKKQADALEQKPISDVQVRETVGQIILLNDKISGESGIIQQKIEELKRDGLSDAEAVSKAFLDPAIAPAVLAELPEDIKGLPQTQEFIKSELVKISNYVKREYANRALNR